MSWLVPEVRVGDITLPTITPPTDDDPSDGDVQVIQQPCSWFVQDTDADEEDRSSVTSGGRGNLPREGALLLPIPMPRRRHSWICRFFFFFFLLVSLLDLRPSIINIRLSLCLRHETSWIFPALYSIIICALDAIIQTHLQMESFSIASTRAPHKVAHFMFFTELPTCTILLTFSTHLHLERRRRVKNNWNFHKSCWRSRELRDA